jgi:hypothetical protein
VRNRGRHRNAGRPAAGDVETIPVSAVIGPLGDQLIQVRYNRDLPSSASATGYTITASGGATTVSSSTVSGGISRVLSSRKLTAGETVTVSYSPGNLHGVKAFTDFPVTNAIE